MTVAGIIEQYNTERPNQVEDGLKMGWLKKFERMIFNIVVLTHEDAPDEEEIEEHFSDFDMDTELFIKEPYDDVYIEYLDQRVAYNNNDYKRYNVASQFYNNAMLNFQQYYNHTHRPLESKSYLLRHEVL